MLVYSHDWNMGFFWWLAKYSLKVFLIHKKVMWLIPGVNKRVTYRGIFSEFKILTLRLHYIFEIPCFIKKLEGSLNIFFPDVWLKYER